MRPQMFIVMFGSGPGGSAKLAMRKSGTRQQLRDVNAGQVSQLSQPNNGCCSSVSSFIPLLSKTTTTAVLAEPSHQTLALSLRAVTALL